MERVGDRTDVAETGFTSPTSAVPPTAEGGRSVLARNGPGRPDGEEAPPGFRVRLVIEGLASGETASYEHRRGLRSVRGDLTAAEGDPAPRVELDHLAGPGGADDAEELLVSAEGYVRQGFDLDLVSDGEEVLCRLVRGRPLRVEFPGLAGRGGHLSVSLHWQGAPGSTDAARVQGTPLPGSPPPGLPVLETRTLENAGHAVFEAVPVPSRATLSVLSAPLIPEGAPPVQIFGAMVSLDAGRTTLSFPDLEAHLVDFVAPEPGRPFELSFLPLAPRPMTRPEGARSRGWTNSYGFYGPFELRSDPGGALRLHLPPTLETKGRYRPSGRGPSVGPVRPQPAPEDAEAWRPLEPIEISADGAVTLTVDSGR